MLTNYMQLNSKLKKRLTILVILIILSSIADCLSIVSIVPFFYLSNPNNLLEKVNLFESIS